MKWLRGFASLPVRLRRITSAGAYRPEIDGLRFFAVAIVVIGHLSERVARFQHTVSVPARSESALFDLLDHPAAGAMLFFTISGFIIASQYLKKSHNPLGGEYLRPYFLRRITRIEPPYVILLIATFLLLEFTKFTPPDVNRFWSNPASLKESLIASLLYSHGWLYGTVPRLFGPGWSLEIEVQFYIIAPLLFYYLFVRADPRRRMMTGLFALMAAIIVAQFAKSLGDRHVMRTLPVYLPYFLLGLVLADVNQRFPRLFSALPAAAVSGAAWIGVLALSTLPHALPIPFAMYQTALLLCIAAMFGGAFGQGSFRAFCGSPWVSTIGGACYSLYLTHLQVLQISAFGIHLLLGQHAPHSWFAALLLYGVIQIPLTIAVGLIFYICAERPFMKPKWPSLTLAWLRNLMNGNGERTPLGETNQTTVLVWLRESTISSPDLRVGLSAGMRED